MNIGVLCRFPLPINLVIRMNVIILHLSAVFQKQEMATQKLQEEIAAKEKIVARCNVSVAGFV